MDGEREIVVGEKLTEYKEKFNQSQTTTHLLRFFLLKISTPGPSPRSGTGMLLSRDIVNPNKMLELGWHVMLLNVSNTNFNV